MSTNEKISLLVKNQFPDFFKEEGPVFLDFMEAYYAWMEENGQVTDGIRNLKSYRDIATTTNDYIDYFFKELLPSVPVDVLGDKKLMAKYVKEFNRSRGTLASYKLLFRSVFNEDVELYYPSESVIKVSDGQWTLDRYLTTSYDDATYGFIGQTIKGNETGSEAFVENVIRFSVRGRDIQKIVVSRVKGTFKHLERVRLKSDVNATGHTPIVEAGINRIEMTDVVGGYSPGDVVDIVSQDTGNYGKVIVAKTLDLGGEVSFIIQDGGSGYIDSLRSDGTEITITGGEGVGANFEVTTPGLREFYPIAINTDRVQSNTIYLRRPPVVADEDGNLMTMDSFANTLLCAPNFGFGNTSATLANNDYRDHENAILRVASATNPGITNTTILTTNNIYSVYANGVATGANGQIKWADTYGSGQLNMRIDAFSNFYFGETVKLGSPTGTTIGTVSNFEGNTVGPHILEIATTTGNVLKVNDEVKGLNSGAYGVIKKVGAANNGAYTNPNNPADVRDVYPYLVTANSTANVSSQFATGPMTPFLSEEPIIVINSGSGASGTIPAGTVVGNSISNTTNSSIETIYTTLENALIFKTESVGTIVKLAAVQKGRDYEYAPSVRVNHEDVADLGIRESIITIRSSNNLLLNVAANNRITQANINGSVIADVQRVYPATAQTISTTGTGTYEIKVKVWQREEQARQGINWTYNANGLLEFLTDPYMPGFILDERYTSNSIPITVTNVKSRGIIGENANVVSRAYPNGYIGQLRILDSGYVYKDGEVIRFPNGGVGVVHLAGVANSEGYYSTARSHVSSARGVVQDGYYYQEYSYEIISPVSLNRYRDMALKLVHPGGQALFGKYRTQSNNIVEVSANTAKEIMRKANGCFSITRPIANGTVSIANNSFNLIGNTTQLHTQFPSNTDFNIVIEIDPGTGHKNQFWTLNVREANSAITANLFNKWIYGDVTEANVYFSNNFTINGSAQSNLLYTEVNIWGVANTVFSNNQFVYIETAPGDLKKVQLNTILSSNTANLVTQWTEGDVVCANVYYSANVIVDCHYDYWQQFIGIGCK